MKQNRSGEVGRRLERERERERVLISGFPSLSYVSCSEKPADRSPSRLCRHTGAPRRLVRYDNIHLDSSILTLVLLISILSSNTFVPYPPVLPLPSTERRPALRDIFFFFLPFSSFMVVLYPTFNNRYPYLLPLATLRNEPHSMGVGIFNAALSLVVNIQS